MAWRDHRIIALAALIFAALILTLLTQIGGIVLVLAYLLARFLRRKGWRLPARSIAALVAGVLIYASTTVALVPPLAALGGREPLPCSGNAAGTLRAAHPAYCILNRNYVDPRLRQLLDALSAVMAEEHPGTITLFLDAGFPFLDGFPMLPHISHDDGLKLDVAFYYRSETGEYLPSRTRSPMGYWAFEQPRAGDSLPCANDNRWPTLRWDMAFLQPYWPDWPLDEARLRDALDWLAVEGPALGVEKILLEPHLKARLGLTADLIRFQGCRAARHDDHFHIQIVDD